MFKLISSVAVIHHLCYFYVKFVSQVEKSKKSKITNDRNEVLRKKNHKVNKNELKCHWNSSKSPASTMSSPRTTTSSRSCVSVSPAILSKSENFQHVKTQFTLFLTLVNVTPVSHSTLPLSTSISHYNTHTHTESQKFIASLVRSPRERINTKNTKTKN